MTKLFSIVLLSCAIAASQPLRVGTFPQQVAQFYSMADGLPSNDVLDIFVNAGKVYVKTAAGDAVFNGQKWQRVVAAPEREGVRTPPGMQVAPGAPISDIAAVAIAADNSTWYGTEQGALRNYGAVWEYRQGLRWLPHDRVRAIATLGDEAWFATPGGVSAIRQHPTTLAEKAAFFEEEIDKRHRRTVYGYVDGVRTAAPGDKSKWTQRDSDNDGLWTAMYGAGECFACAATNSEAACNRARSAFEALRFLGAVTQGGKNPAPGGYVARTILPVIERNPNLADSAERDQKLQSRDRLWKVMRPRWPLSTDGKWYWKSDTSSDELDGHYFFYGAYYDMAARTEAEKRRVREHVAALTDHLVGNNFQLIDHDGKPTRWAVFNPENLNHNLDWFADRGLNSISILSYLKTAEHITGDSKYAAAARTLIDKHGYHTNTLIPKSHGGAGSGNQSDDEMAFMCLYNLMKFETDPRLRMFYGRALRNRWEVERPELNPLFNFLAAAGLKGVVFDSVYGAESLALGGAWLEESVDTLRRYPLDRFNWPIRNSHRKDVFLLPAYSDSRAGLRGHLGNGRVLPIDERYVDHWNHDPWQLDYSGNGQHLADGASFLLPYYLGLYHKFID